MEDRVAKLESELADVRITLARIDEKLNVLASKEDVAKLTAEVAKIDGAMKGTLGFWQFLAVIAVVMGLVTKWPELFRTFGV